MSYDFHFETNNPSGFDSAICGDSANSRTFYLMPFPLNFPPRLLAFAGVVILDALQLKAVPTLDPQRNLLSGPAEVHRLGEDLPGIQADLLPHGAWTPFPRAADRAAWEGLDAATRQMLIANGEPETAAPWTLLPATKLLDYVRNGDRSSYQTLLAAKRTASSPSSSPNVPKAKAVLWRPSPMASGPTSKNHSGGTQLTSSCNAPGRGSPT
jgi:hypothetical protein